MKHDHDFQRAGAPAADWPCRIAEIAVRAMLLEAAATPKPGLVDRENSGAHADMDFFTFLRGTAALGALDAPAGAAGDGEHAGSLPALFAALRQSAGTRKRPCCAPRAMSTRSAAWFFPWGWPAASPDIWRARKAALRRARLCRQMTAAARGLCARELHRLPPARLTPGELAFRRQAPPGARRD